MGEFFQAHLGHDGKDSHARWGQGGHQGAGTAKDAQASQSCQASIL